VIGLWIAASLVLAVGANGATAAEAFGGGAAEQTASLSAEPMPPVVAQISLSSQTMTVYLNAKPSYTFTVSTGRDGYGTPTGSWRAQWLSPRHRSSKYNNAPMPWSVFFYKGYAVHGTTEVDQHHDQHRELELMTVELEHLTDEAVDQTAELPDLGVSCRREAEVVGVEVECQQQRNEGSRKQDSSHRSPQSEVGAGWASYRTPSIRPLVFLPQDAVVAKHGSRRRSLAVTGITTNPTEPTLYRA